MAKARSSSKQSRAPAQQQNGGHSKLAKYLDPEASLDKDQLLDALHWIRQALGLLCGLLWGAVPLVGAVWIVLFLAISTGIIYWYYTYLLKIDEEEYGGHGSLLQEGLFASFTLFLEPTMYNYILSNPQFVPPPTNAPNTQLSSVVAIPELYNVSSSVGQNQLQAVEPVRSDYQRIRSNNVLQYISQMLMEDVDERVGLHQREAALQAAEKPFYDILAQDRLSICRVTTKGKVGERSRFGLFKVTDHRNNPYVQDLNDLGGTSNAITSCEIIRNEKFDRLLLCCDMECFKETLNLRKMMASVNSPKGQGKGPSQQKLQGKKRLRKEMVDLRSLLIHCAQAVAADDRQLASDLLRKIRQHSSADGDCTQRLAFYLVDGLEARLTGIGSRAYYKLMAKRVSDEAVIKAYKLYLASCPFYRASYTFANQTIIDAAKGKSRVHIVDFGICFGFQWPSLIQQFAELGVSPILRITGIDVRRPGFHPLEIIEEAGKRLADYAKIFKVPFEYQGISSRFETIQIEDLNIEGG
ncbi:hypothetical protein PR202_gb25179 [Eleusine coracana subsp. coracana]|uniref:Scarecrow-like protein 9 n=1 Tax=Eleusine coracana subsp. coracana TaxID=191504 RepID=A0AAV5FPG7_ELECO|nr:hypothetical protein PR202_gb25179 [Eleusine coracana subsp. coracana]